jgi:hypothetical protein
MFYLVYENGNKKKVDLLVDEFNSSMKKIGVEFRSGDMLNI